MTKIAVIGAGITGATTAYALYERGVDVTIIEKEKYAGMVTSFANGGQLSASNAEVWNNWGTVMKGMKMLMKKDAPLALNPKPSAAKYSWFARFLNEVQNHDDNTMETTRLAIAAREHLLRMAEAENIDFNCEKRGLLHFYKSKEDFDAAKTGQDLMVKAGLKRHAVTPDEIRDIEPSLTGDIHAGYYTPDDFSGDIHKYTQGLVKALEDKGVPVKFQTSVEDIRNQNGKVILSLSTDGDTTEELFDNVIICAGVASRQLGAKSGDALPIYPVKGYSITVDVGPDHIDDAPWVSLLDEDAKIVTSRHGADRFRVAGTAEFNGYNRDIRMDRVEPLVRWVEKHFPNLPTNKYQSWAGLRPMTPNLMPRVGPGQMDGVFFNTGHGHLGWTLSAITAQMTADIVEQRAA